MNSCARMFLYIIVIFTMYNITVLWNTEANSFKVLADHYKDMKEQFLYNWSKSNENTDSDGDEIQQDFEEDLNEQKGYLLFTENVLQQDVLNVEHNERTSMSLYLHLLINQLKEDFMDEIDKNGFNNSNGINVSALVPSEGGTPVRSLVVTSWRSGSTFIGELLNEQTGSYYHCEPFESYGIKQIRKGNCSEDALALMRDLFTCNFTERSDYIEFVNSRSWLLQQNKRIWNICKDQPLFCTDISFVSDICNVFPYHIMKTVRLRLNLVEEFLQSEKFNLRVLYLVRDPRGTLQSRTHREWCPENPDCDDPFHLCGDLISDYYAARKLIKLFPDTFRVIRYEDMSLDIYNQTESIFDFFNLQFSDNIKSYLDSHTTENHGGVSSTSRDSKTAPFHWMQEMDNDTILKVQNACDGALKLWGYKEMDFDEDINEFNPLHNFTINEDDCFPITFINHP